MTLTVFWQQRREVMMATLAKDNTINGEYYASLLQNLQDSVKAKRCDMLTKGVHLHQDNTPVHNARVAPRKAHSCGYEIFPLSPYSPDLILSDLHLFPAIKSFLKGKHFSDDDELISELRSWLQSQATDFYKRARHDCINRWEKCVAIFSAYVEKN